jgi:hypothetical protein
MLQLCHGELNVFQGFLIFALFTAGNKKVRQNWKKLCCKEKPGDEYSKSESFAVKIVIYLVLRCKHCNIFGPSLQTL